MKVLVTLLVTPAWMMCKTPFLCGFQNGYRVRFPSESLNKFRKCQTGVSGFSFFENSETIKSYILDRAVSKDSAHRKYCFYNNYFGG